MTLMNTKIAGFSTVPYHGYLLRGYGTMSLGVFSPAVLQKGGCCPPEQCILEETKIMVH